MPSEDEELPEDDEELAKYMEERNKNLAMQGRDASLALTRDADHRVDLKREVAELLEGVDGPEYVEEVFLTVNGQKFYESVPVNNLQWFMFKYCELLNDTLDIYDETDKWMDADEWIDEEMNAPYYNLSIQSWNSGLAEVSEQWQGCRGSLAWIVCWSGQNHTLLPFSLIIMWWKWWTLEWMQNTT